MADRPKTDLAKRDTRVSIMRGLHGRCPNCGSGPLLSSYLRVRDHCPVCLEKLRKHRVTNAPAYVTIFLVTLIMTPFLTFVFVQFHPDPLVLFTIFAVGCVGLSLYLLPKMKGAIVAFQWARRLYGFAEPK